MRIVGIDPGKDGAIARIEHGRGEVEDLPLIQDKSIYWIDGLRFAEQLRVFAPDVAVVERVSAMPKQGTTSCFHFGMVFGSILAVLQTMHVRIELVTPVVWKRAQGINGSPDKKTAKMWALNKARVCFPGINLELKKHHNRAEALLIADWYCRYQLTLPSSQTVRSELSHLAP